jgi:hypothetical protein
LKAIRVKQFDKLGTCVACYESISAAAKATGINTGNIWSCISFIRREAGGFGWRACGNTIKEKE